MLTHVVDALRLDSGTRAVRGGAPKAEDMTSMSPERAPRPRPKFGIKPGGRGTQMASLVAVATMLGVPLFSPQDGQGIGPSAHLAPDGAAAKQCVDAEGKPARCEDEGARPASASLLFADPMIADKRLSVSRSESYPGGPCTAHYGRTKACCGQIKKVEDGTPPDVRPCPQISPICVDYVYNKHYGICKGVNEAFAADLSPPPSPSPTPPSPASPPPWSSPPSLSPLYPPGLAPPRIQEWNAQAKAEPEIWGESVAAEPEVVWGDPSAEKPPQAGVTGYWDKDMQWVSPETESSRSAGVRPREQREDAALRASDQPNNDPPLTADSCRGDKLCRCKIFAECSKGMTTEPTSRYPLHKAEHYCKYYGLCGSDLPEHLRAAEPR